MVPKFSNQAQLTTWARILLWFIVEIALIGADIQEVSGSAIALQILTCAFLPIWPLDFISREVLNEETRRSFCGLIATMPLSFSWMFNETKRSGQELFIGILVPDNLTSCWSCWMCNNSSQCVLAFGFSAVEIDKSKGYKQSPGSS
ncbi:hypothetical protein F2Q69_00044272 [Brassica cretica]|uniref:Uncharacterized protein n=1 Tax=Brassica cretica TaxID=69181 RepID=A0A8S9NMJ2_BRACR|nr:hypothetical protein F2Q69_00044272 [Brassica cretica]